MPKCPTFPVRSRRIGTITRTVAKQGRPLPHHTMHVQAATTPPPPSPTSSTKPEVEDEPPKVLADPTHHPIYNTIDLVANYDNDGPIFHIHTQHPCRYRYTSIKDRLFYTHRIVEKEFIPLPCF